MRRQYRMMIALGCALATVVSASTIAVASVPAAPAAVSGVLADPAFDAQKLDKQIADLKDNLEGAKSDFVAAAVDLRKSQAQLDAAQQRLATAQQHVLTAKQRDQQLGNQLAFAQAEHQKAEQTLRAQQQAQEQAKDKVGRIAVATYMGRQVNGLSVLMQATTPEQLTEQAVMAQTAMRLQNRALSQLSVQQAQQAEQAAKIAATGERIAQLKKDAEQAVRDTQAAEQGAAKASSAVATQVQAKQRATDAISAKIASEKQRLADLQAEQDKLRALIVRRASSSGRARNSDAGAGAGTGSSGFLSAPAAGSVTSEFGMRYHPILHYSRLHSGMDYGIDCGTPVRAAASGSVISAGWAGGYGNRIVIDHGTVRGGDLATTYNHLTRISVGGGSVSRGQLIGYSGTTGLSTGCHLHFEVLRNGSFVNPRSWM